MAATRKFIVRERDIWSNKYVITESKTVPKLHSTLQRDPIANNHVILNQAMSTNIAVSANLRFFHDDDELPDSTTLTNRRRIHICKAVNENIIHESSKV